MNPHPQPILAYVALFFGGVTFAGALFRHDSILSLGLFFGFFVTITHAIAFMIRSHKRREVADFESRGKAILAITLGAMMAVVVANFVVDAVHLDALADFGMRSVAFLWLALVGVLTYRAWRHPSARRAAALQLVAVFVGIPQMVVTTAVTDRDSDTAVWMLIVTYMTICAAGPVLDKLYASVADKEPTSIPSAIVHR